MSAFRNVCMLTIRIWLREPMTVFLSLGLLVLMMVLFSTMGNDTFQYQLKVGVVAPASSAAEIMDRLQKDGTLKAIPAESATALEEDIRLGNLNAGVVAESGAQPGHAGVTLLLPRFNSTGWAAVANNHLAYVMDPSGGTTRKSNLAIQNVVAPQVSTRLIDFLFPGILSLAILQTCLGSAVVFLDARRLGILRRFRIAPVHPATWSCGFLAGRCAIVLMHLLVLTVVARLFFHVHTLGNIQDVCLVTLTGTICFLALSGIIALLAPSVEAGALLTQLLNFPMSFLCGVFFRNDNLSPFLHRIVDVLPFTYMVNLMREIVQMGVPLRELHREMTALLLWTAIALLTLAIASRFHSNKMV